MTIESIPSVRFIPLIYKELLHAELRIVEVKGLSVQSKAAIVRVDKLSVKGLRFVSELLFPVNPQNIINFHMEILNETIDLKGTITWRQREESLNLFEVVFIMDEITKAELVAVLGKLVKRYIPLHLKAEYYYHYFSESTYDFNNSRINLFL
jgi:hypothetical protein